MSQRIVCTVTFQLIMFLMSCAQIHKLHYDGSKASVLNK